MKDLEEVLASAVLESGFVIPSWDIMAKDILGKLGLVQEKQSSKLNIVVTESLVSTDCVLREMEYAKTQPQVTKLLVEGLVTRRKDRVMIWDAIQGTLLTAAQGEEEGIVAKKKKVWEDIRFVDTIRVFDDPEDQHGLARASFALMEFELKLQQLWEDHLFVLMNDKCDGLVKVGRTMPGLFRFQLGLEFDNAGTTLEDFIKILKILQESEILESVECGIGGRQSFVNNNSQSLWDVAAGDKALLLFPNKLADLFDHHDHQRPVVTLNLIYAPTRQQNEQTKKYTTALLHRCQEQLNKMTNSNKDEEKTTTTSPTEDDSIRAVSRDDDTATRTGISRRKLLRRRSTSVPSLDTMVSGGGREEKKALLGSRKRLGKHKSNDEVGWSRVLPASTTSAAAMAPPSFTAATVKTTGGRRKLLESGTKRGGGGVTRSVSPKPSRNRRHNGGVRRGNTGKMADTQRLPQ